MGEISSGGQPGNRGKRIYHASIGTPHHSTLFSIRETELIRARALSVAFIKARRFHDGNVEYEQYGTGWLIAPGLLLTCWHVVAALMDAEEAPPEEADMQRQLKDMLIFFNQTERIEDSTEYSVETLEFKGTREQDFAVLRLLNRKNHPFEHFGYLPVETDAPLTTQTQLFVIQHPLGKPQQVAVGGFVDDTDLPDRIRYTAETHPGTSGAPVLKRHNGGVIALHNGKIEDESVHSEGTRISVILNILRIQAPGLYREIMLAQDEITGILRGEAQRKGFTDTASTTQRERYAADEPEASTLRSEERHHHSAPMPDKRLHYSYWEAYHSNDPILCLTFDPTGKEILYGGQADGIHRLDTATLRLLSICKTCTRAVISLAVSPNGTYVASGGDDGTLVLWHLPQFTRYKTLQAHGDWVSCAVFSANGRYLLSGSDDGSLRILEIGSRSSQILRRSGAILALTSHPQKELIASCSLDQQPIVWPITSDSNSDPFELAKRANCLCFSPTGRYLASGDAEGALVIYDTQDWSPTPLPTKHKKAVHCLAFHPSGTFMVSAGDDRDIQLWDITTGQHRPLLTGHTARITSLAFSPDGHFLVSAGRDGNLFVWKAD